MTSRDDPAPIRLEPHQADDRLALLRIDRPPVNAFDQRMWDLFADIAASLHGDTSPAPAARSVCHGSSDPGGPRR